MIEGVNSLKSIKFNIMGDRIEAGTFSVLACLNQGDLEIKNFNPNFIKKEIECLKKIGAKITVRKNSIKITIYPNSSECSTKYIRQKLLYVFFIY